MARKRLKTYLSPCDQATRISEGIQLLKQARECFRVAGCTKTYDRVRLALTSAEGAARHCSLRPYRDAPHQSASTRLTVDDILRMTAEKCVNEHFRHGKLPREPRARDWKEVTQAWRAYTPEGISADDGEGLPSLAAATFREEFKRAVALRSVKRGG